MSLESLREFSNFLLLFGLVCAALGTVGVNHFRAAIERQRNAEAREEADRRQKREADLTSQVTHLVDTSGRLEQQLAPFRTLAIQRFPQLPEREALTQLEQSIGALKARTQTLEQRTEPRSLSDQGRISLIVQLRSFAWASVKISCRAFDPEAFSLAQQLGDCFRQAGWTVEGPVNATRPNPVYGIRLITRDPDPPFLKVVFQALVSHHFAPDTDVSQAFSPNHLDVFVASRPVN